jgi:hypothetical protein
MTKFEDQLFGQLMTEHRHQLRALERPAPARGPARRLVWLATGVAGAVAGVTAAVMALGSAPAMAAYSVTRHADGTVTVAVNRPSGVAGANAALHAIGARVVVVPVRPGCPSIGSLPHAGVHAPGMSVGSGVNGQGHRSVTVRVWGNGGIPAGDTMMVMFSGSPGSALAGTAGVVTGRAPRCVSLPHAPSPGSGSAVPAP